MNWVKRHKLLAVEAIQYNSCLCNKLEDLWRVLHMFFNSTQNCQIDLQILDELSDKEVTTWVSFSSNELRSAIKKCSNTSTSGLDKLS